jgi:methionyl-tRNA formyltransferase
VTNQQSTAIPESWRVVVVTNVPGGIVYRLVDQVVRPLGHRVTAILTTPGPKRRRSDSYLDVVAAASPGVDVLVSNHPQRWAAMLAPLQPDLIICCGMPWILPPDLIALPRLGAINLHPALLPQYRGPAAIEWAFRNGDTETGFTAHWIAPKVDTGAILAQERVTIADDDTVETLLTKFSGIMPRLLQRALTRVAAGDPGDPQDESRASYAGLFDEAWRHIRWDRPARLVHNQVRSWTGVRDIPNGAFGEVAGERLLITRTHLGLTRTEAIRSVARGNAEPGSVLHRDGPCLIVQCGDGPLAVLNWSRVGIGAA